MFGWKDMDNNGFVWDFFQFKFDDKGDWILIGVGSYGWGFKYDGQLICNYDGIWINYLFYKNNMLDLY